jgi:metal-responsive CopG/Arc/MetJ family transcriptional regulator
MKTVQMTLDEDLVRGVDRVRRKLNQSRSAFTRNALRESLARYNVTQQEAKHREGYERHPVASNEFAVWEDEQRWGDE